MMNRDIRDRQKKAYDVGALSGGGKLRGSMVSKTSLLHNFSIHINAYITDLTIIRGDIKNLCKNHPEILSSEEFREIISRYKPFEKFAINCIKRYSKKRHNTTIILK